MKNEIKNKNEVSSSSIPQNEDYNTSNAKEEKIELLTSGDYYIAFNEKQDIPIWNYLLSEDKTKVYIYDENDEIIYDDLVIDAPENLFTYGERFEKVSFNGLNLDDNVVSRKNFYLFKRQLSRDMEVESNHVCGN